MKKLTMLLAILIALPSLALATPQFRSAAVAVANNTEYAPGVTDAANYYGFEINITDSVGGVSVVSSPKFENNFNGSTWNATPTNNTNGIYWINFTHITNISAANTLYTYKWYADNVTTGNENASTSTTYFIQKNQTVPVVTNITVYAHGGTQSNHTDSAATSWEGQGDPYADCWMGTSPDGTGQTLWGTTSLYRDGASWTKGSSGALTLASGSYTVKCNSTGNANYTNNATGHSFTLTVSALGGGDSGDIIEDVEPPVGLPPISAPSLGISEGVSRGSNFLLDLGRAIWNGIVGFFTPLINLFR